MRNPLKLVSTASSLQTSLSSAMRWTKLWGRSTLKTVEVLGDAQTSGRDRQAGRKKSVVDHVLGRFSSGELKTVDKVVDQSVELLLTQLSHDSPSTSSPTGGRQTAAEKRKKKNHQD